MVADVLLKNVSTRSFFKMNVHERAGWEKGDSLTYQLLVTFIQVIHQADNEVCAEHADPALTEASGSGSRAPRDRDKSDIDRTA